MQIKVPTFFKLSNHILDLFKIEPTVPCVWNKNIMRMRCQVTLNECIIDLYLSDLEKTCLVFIFVENKYCSIAMLLVIWDTGSC